jgi:hypothetical protein
VAPIIICIGFSSVLNAYINDSFTTDPNIQITKIILSIGYILGIAGAVFGFFSIIAFVVLITKSITQYGNQKEINKYNYDYYCYA